MELRCTGNAGTADAGADRRAVGNRVAAASASPSVAPSASPSPSANIPTGWTAHDVAARNKIRRYVGDLALPLQNIYPAPVYLKLADILGVQDGYPELKMKPAFVQVPQLVLNDALHPLTPTLEGDVKVFRLTIDEIEQNIDELLPSVKALGYNAQWPGRRSAPPRATSCGSSSRTT